MTELHAIEIAQRIFNYYHRCQTQPRSFSVKILLEQRGFSRTQAEGITEALKELDATNLVTKKELELALAKTTTTIIIWMTGALLAQVALVGALIQYFK